MNEKIFTTCYKAGRYTIGVITAPPYAIANNLRFNFTSEYTARLSICL